LDTFLLSKGFIKFTQASDLELTQSGTKAFEAEGEKLYASSYRPGCDIAQLNVILGNRGPSEITGIIHSPGNTSAIVEYTRTATLNQLGGEFSVFRSGLTLEQRIDWRKTAEIFGIPDGVEFETRESHIAKFVKYDDGWRIVFIK
jgi:hypothetical protein